MELARRLSESGRLGTSRGASTKRAAGLVRLRHRRREPPRDVCGSRTCRGRRARDRRRARSERSSQPPRHSRAWLAGLGLPDGARLGDRRARLGDAVARGCGAGRRPRGRRPLHRRCACHRDDTVRLRRPHRSRPSVTPPSTPSSPACWIPPSKRGCGGPATPDPCTACCRPHADALSPALPSELAMLLDGQQRGGERSARRRRRRRDDGAPRGAGDAGRPGPLRARLRGRLGLGEARQPGRGDPRLRRDGGVRGRRRRRCVCGRASTSVVSATNAATSPARASISPRCCRRRRTIAAPAATSS